MTKVSEPLHPSVSTEIASIDTNDTPAAPPAQKPVNTVERWAQNATTWLEEKTLSWTGDAKSVALSALDTLPLKEKSPVSTALLKHYVERSGEPFRLESIPPDWQKWIQSATRGKTGKFHNLNPYNSGLYDLRNSLGHFNVEVKRNANGTKTYSISDTYQFGSLNHDSAQRGRHGFPLGNRSPMITEMLKHALPSGEYKNPGGFTERWEIKQVGSETVLFIPQAFLAEQGKPFTVTGTFTTP